MSPENWINFLLGVLASIAFALFAALVKKLISRDADFELVKKAMGGLATREELNQLAAIQAKLQAEVDTDMPHEVKWTRGGNWVIVPITQKVKPND